MDDDSRRRRLHEAPQYGNTNLRYGQDQNHGSSQGRGYTIDSSDRYRPASISTTSIGSHGITGPSAAYTTYYADSGPSFASAIPTNSLQYNAGAAYTHDQRPAQGYAGYNPAINYNVAQPAPQTSTYNAPQQFQARQSASIQLSSQLSSDVAVPYYGTDPSGASGPSILQHAPSNSSINYPSSNIHGYAPNIGGMAPGSVDEHGAMQSGGASEAYEMYQDALKQIFENIRVGKLVEAAASTLEVSDWLLSHVGQLGLTGDDQALHGDRIRLWNEFNHTWLTMLEKQKDLSEEFLRTGARPRPPQSLITVDFLKKMAEELIRLADGVEKHGLVDYQLGVWEERIMEILIKCLQLLENDASDEGGGPP